MSVANTRPRCVPLLDDFLELAIRDLEAALHEISVSAALLDAQLADEPAQSAPRSLARDMRVQVQRVARILDAVLDGDRQSW